MPQLVVIAEQLLASVPGGTGRYTAELVPALARTAPAGWEVGTVVARHRDVSAASVDGAGGPRVLAVPRRALAMAWERGVPLWPGGDAVHAPTPLAPPRPPRGRSLVVTVHDTVPWTHPHTLTGRGARWHRRVVARAGRLAGALAVPTLAVATELAEHVAPSCPVHVVGAGVAPALAEAPDDRRAAEVARRLRLPPRYLLMVGTIEPRKGLDVLVRALAEPDAPRLPLVLVGQPGWGAVDPARLAEEAGLGRDRLCVLGRVGDAELAVVLRRAAALVVPSLAEGFGLPLLEAMAAGVPVVHTDVPALLEVAGGAGVAVPRADPRALAAGIRAVLDHPERTAARVATGRARAAQFTWERTAAAVWRIHTEQHRRRRRVGVPAFMV
jgi:glycosyltransferase involved in cell wall biosynthesis